MQEISQLKVYTNWKELENAVDKSDGRGIYAAIRGRVFACVRFPLLRSGDLLESFQV